MQALCFSYIFFMQKVNQSESSQDIEMRETQTVSPDSIVREQASSESLPARSRWWCYWKRCTFLAMLVLCSLMLGYEINAQRPADVINIKTNTMSNYDQFSFLVFCPYSYYNKTRSFQRQQNGELRRMLQEQDIYNYELKVSDPSYDANSTYVVEARSLLFYFNTTDKNTGVRTLGNRTELFYCGVVRNYSDVCENSFMACSTPGPIFDIPDRKSVDIIWVNRLDRNILPEVSGTCFDNFQQIDEKGQPYPCKNMAKDDQKQATYLDPTQMGQFHSNIYLSPKNWPMTTHVHGAEIRPTFDGNPLSWIDNNHYDDGRVGVATFSLDEQCYYSSFDKIVNGSNFHPPNIQLIGQVVNKSNYKINRYPNRQNPGNLWYHDHAMHLTDYNVGNGLQGLYILRDAQVERKIGVSRENEKLVLIVGLGYNKTTASFNINSGFIAGEVYRFRFLNNNFDDGDRSMIAVSFSYNECNDAIKQRQKFTIIGADSSLFNTGIYNQTHFVIAQAQRMEILIKFNQTKSFAICADEWKTSIHDLFASHRNRGLTETVRRVVNRNHQIEENQMPQSHVQHEFSDLPNRKTSLSGIKILARPHEYKSLNTRKDINDVNLGVPFPDLRNVNDSQIAVKRMRPLLWIGHKIFTINGRLEFHSGWSENPTIGTIEDWIIPNTIWFPHPIHVHLINFQVIREYDLQLLMPDKSNPSTYCSIYELDFLRMSVDLAMNLTGAASDKILLRAKKQIYPEGPDGRVDYSFLCKNRTFIGYQATVRKALAIIFPEYSIDSNRVSGLNLLSKFASNNNTIFKSLLALNSNLSYPLDKNNGQNQFIYVRDEGHPSRKPYYGRLKDTAFVEPFKALHYRIRWAKSDFTEKDAKEGTYFNVPNDQLREFPGYVYHCHILRHEDNEMMRPIMLQLPQNAKLDKETHCNYNDTHTSSPIPNFLWEDKYNCINNRCKTLKKKLAP